MLLVSSAKFCTRSKVGDDQEHDSAWGTRVSRDCRSNGQGSSTSNSSLIYHHDKAQTLSDDESFDSNINTRTTQFEIAPVSVVCALLKHVQRR